MSKANGFIIDVLRSHGQRQPSTGCPSWRQLDQWRCGELTSADTRALEAHLDVCTECQGRLRSESDAFRSIDSDALLKAVARRPSYTRVMRSGLASLALAAVAMLALRGAARTPEVAADGDIIAKGSNALTFKVFSERAGKVHELEPGDSAAPGDRLRFSVALPKRAQIMVFGAEASGRTFVYYPTDGRSASSPSDLLTHTGVLEGAAELDESLGEEAIFFVACERSFELPASSERIPEGCESIRFALRKVAR